MRRDDQDSLATQAAAWVPPWARELAPKIEPASDQVPEADVQVEPAEDSTPPEPRPSGAGEGAVPTAAVSTVDDGRRASTVDGDGAAGVPGAVATAGGAQPATGGEPGGEAEPEIDGGREVGAESAAVEPGAEPAVGTDPPAVAGADDAPAAGTAASGTSAAEDEVPGPEAVFMDEAELGAALEAILLVVDEPVGELTLAQVLEQPMDRVRTALTTLAREYAEGGRGFDLRRAAGGWRLYTRSEYASYVERFVLDGQQVRLTQAALETLAVVAYKQPVTRSRISAIRGVNCDGVIRTLVNRGLVQESGTEPETGAYLYRTTTLFLEKLGLDTVDALPPLAPFLPDDVDAVADATH